MKKILLSISICFLLASCSLHYDNFQIYRGLKGEKIELSKENINELFEIISNYEFIEENLLDDNYRTEEYGQDLYIIEYTENNIDYKWIISTEAVSLEKIENNNSSIYMQFDKEVIKKISKIIYNS